MRFHFAISEFCKKKNVYGQSRVIIAIYSSSIFGFFIFFSSSAEVQNVQCWPCCVHLSRFSCKCDCPRYCVPIYCVIEKKNFTVCIRCYVTDWRSAVIVTMWNFIPPHTMWSTLDSAPRPCVFCQELEFNWTLLMVVFTTFDEHLFFTLNIQCMY